MTATIVADSIAPSGVRVTTMRVLLATYLLAQFVTHRDLSRNVSSTRALAHDFVRRMAVSDPFVPHHWGTEKPGMEAGPPLEGEDELAAIEIWLNARDSMVAYHDQLASRGVHKQIANRLLMPFLTSEILVTSTTWDNFFELRTSSHVDPEFKPAATAMRDALVASTPNVLQEGEWHMPLVSDAERGQYSLREQLMLSAGRCARVSYLSGSKGDAADLKLARRLLKNKHMSPFEHQAMAVRSSRLRSGNLHGWRQLRDVLDVVYHPGFTGLLGSV